MLQPQVRGSVTALEVLLDPDCLEFGTSGRRFTREQIVTDLVAAGGVAFEATAEDFEYAARAPDLVQLRYVSVIHQECAPLRRAWRSSIWRRGSQGWRLLFHQGTLIPDSRFPIPDEAHCMSQTPYLTHLDAAGLPAMVDVSDKPTSARQALAGASVCFPETVARWLQEAGLRSAKGGIVETAIVAGTQAVKRTHELIPFCHPLPIDGCRFEVEWQDPTTLRITCTVKTVHRTGVEMEALTGASVAALTVYDMCKALSHDIVIADVQLLGKQGGKRDFTRAQ